MAEYKNHFFKVAFRTALCVKSNISVYKAGVIYPVLGWNNGSHVISTTELGNIYDGEMYDVDGAKLEGEWDERGMPQVEFVVIKQEARTIWRTYE